MLYFEHCEQIWCGSPATTTIEAGIETGELDSVSDDSVNDLSMSSAESTSASTIRSKTSNVSETDFYIVQIQTKTMKFLLHKSSKKDEICSKLTFRDTNKKSLKENFLLKISSSCAHRKNLKWRED